MNRHEELLSAVLRAEADQVRPSPDALETIRMRVARRRARRRWLRPAVAVAAAAALVAGGIVAATQLTGNGRQVLRVTPAHSPTSAPPTSAPSGTPTTAPAPAFGFQPLWPFTSVAAAQQWQRAAASGGHQPWHLDAAQTAVAFSSGYLGFTGVDKIVKQQVRGDDAHVTVGYDSEGGRLGTAATVHLVRIGSGADAPWEVVGTDDTTFSLTTPPYGAAASSPLTVGGVITGVDESIHVQIRQPSSPHPLGDACCTAAGGQDSPWTATVAYHGASDPALTVVAWTGGHLRGVERFTVTGVRAAGAAAYPQTFVGSISGRIAVLSSADGAVLRYLTAAQPGGGDSDAQVVGDQVYFLRGQGTCGNSLLRVPLAGGAPQPLYAPQGAAISGFGVSADGRNLAMALRRCDNGQARLVVRDLQTGRSNETPFLATPPEFVGNLAWAPDGRHLAAVVRTGTAATVFEYDAFAARTWNDGTHPCGDLGGNATGMPSALAYEVDGRLLMAFVDGTPNGVTVAACSNATMRRLATVPAMASAVTLSVDGRAVLLDGTGSSGSTTVYRWTGGGPVHVADGVDSASW